MRLDWFGVYNKPNKAVLGAELPEAIRLAIAAMADEPWQEL